MLLRLIFLISSEKLSYVTNALDIGYTINVIRQSACSGINPITDDSFASLLPVGRA